MQHSVFTTAVTACIMDCLVHAMFVMASVKSMLSIPSSMVQGVLCADTTPAAPASAARALCSVLCVTAKHHPDLIMCMKQPGIGERSSSSA